MIDFHNHLLAAVDDGASTLDESRAALRLMREQGVHTVLVSPHLRASLTEQPAALASALDDFDRAFEKLGEAVLSEFPELELKRGVELMLDTPKPDLSEPRVRMGGSSFVLVEFPSLMVPPHSVQALYELRLQGWRPIAAHPERYHNLEDVEIVDEWRSVGCFLQVNHGSLLGRYGSRAKELAWTLLRNGWVDYLASDYHARGRLPIAEVRDQFVRVGAGAQFERLTRENPSRMLNDEEPLPVDPVEDRQSLWRRLVSRFG